jgi:hypothetical protein
MQKEAIEWRDASDRATGRALEAARHRALTLAVIPKRERWLAYVQEDGRRFRLVGYATTSDGAKSICVAAAEHWSKVAALLLLQRSRSA